MGSRARSHTARSAELRVAALTTLAALALTTGCGGAGQPAAAPPPSPKPPDGGIVDISSTEPVGEMTAGSVASLVECRDWNGATSEQQLATVADVRSQINLEDSGITAPALTDEEALEFFDGSCEPSYAQGFRLYKLYARAAGFIELRRAVEE